MWVEEDVWHDALRREGHVLRRHREPHDALLPMPAPRNKDQSRSCTRPSRVANRECRRSPRCEFVPLLRYARAPGPQLDEDVVRLVGGAADGVHHAVVALLDDGRQVPPGAPLVPVPHLALERGRRLLHHHVPLADAGARGRQAVLVHLVVPVLVAPQHPVPRAHAELLVRAAARLLAGRLHRRAPEHAAVDGRLVHDQRVLLSIIKRNTVNP